MRQVGFSEALAARTRLTLFSSDKPDRLFIVIKFWIDPPLGDHFSSQPVLLPTKSKTRKAEFICCFICQSTKRMKTAGVSGGRINRVDAVWRGRVENFYRRTRPRPFLPTETRKREPVAAGLANYLTVIWTVTFLSCCRIGCTRPSATKTLTPSG